MEHTSVQNFAQIRPDAHLHMKISPQIRPDGAHTYGWAFRGPDTPHVICVGAQNALILTNCGN